MSDDGPKRPRPEEIAERGVELCRDGRLEDGLHWLSMAAQEARSKKELPAMALAWLGYGMAKVEGERMKGLQLCRLAIRREFYHPEAYVLLARIHLLSGEKEGAYRAIEKGLSIDPDSTGLHQVLGQLGQRRPPVLPMLSRKNPINRILGAMRGAPKNAAGAEEEADVRSRRKAPPKQTPPKQPTPSKPSTPANRRR